MKQSSGLKIAAVLVSVSLAAAFVVYKVVNKRADASPAPDGQPVKDDAVLPGSKVRQVFDPADVKSRPVMGGSKSMRIVEPGEVETPAVTPTTTPPPPPPPEKPAPASPGKQPEKP